MTFNVTQEHIDNGKQMRCESCPVSLCIREATGSDAVRTFPLNGIFIDDRHFAAPESVFEFIHHFDNDNVDDIKPFSFELPL